MWRAVALRPLYPNFASGIAEACADPVTFAFTRVPANYTLADAEEFLARCDTDTSAVVVDGEFVGLASLLESEDGVPMLAYLLHPAFRGQGLGTVVVGMLADRAAATGYERVAADVLPGNWASVAVLEKNGFRLVGCSEHWESGRRGVEDGFVDLMRFEREVNP